MARFKKSNRLLRSLKKIRATIEKRAKKLETLEAELKREEKRYSKAKSNFRGELHRLDQQIISDEGYVAIAKNLHLFRKEVVGSSAEIEKLKMEEVELSQYGPEDAAEAARLERELFEYPAISVASLDDVDFLYKENLGHVKIAIVAAVSKAVNQEIRKFCSQHGLRTINNK